MQKCHGFIVATKSDLKNILGTVDSSRRRPSADVEMKAEKAKNIMIERMELHEQNQPETFELIRDAFGIDEIVHENAMKSAKQSILDGDSHWSANITITGKISRKNCTKIGKQKLFQ